MEGPWEAGGRPEAGLWPARGRPRMEEAAVYPQILKFRNHISKNGNVAFLCQWRIHAWHKKCLKNGPAPTPPDQCWRKFCRKTRELFSTTPTL